jgi:tetratricopeptide (TPR) repeat protein
MNSVRLGCRGLKLLAAAWLLLGRDARALAAYDRLLHRCPGDAGGRAGRSHLLARLGRQEDAIADARALVDGHAQGGSAADWFNLAYLLEHTGRLAQAEQAFGRCVALDPALDRAWYGLGLVLMQQQRLDEAIAALRENTRLQPLSPHAWVQLARIHVQRDEHLQAHRVVEHLDGFEPAVAAQLAREFGWPR